MDPKKIMVALVGLVATATWAPLAWQTFQREREPDPTALGAFEGEAGPTEARPGSILAAEEPQPDTVLISDSSAGDLAVRQAGSNKSEDDPGQLGELMLALETFGTGRSTNLTALLAERPSWLDVEPVPVKVEGEVVSPPSADLDRLLEVGALRSSAVDAFLQASPLTAIVHSNSGAWAMVGGRVVREGEELLPGQLVVSRISRRSVELKTHDGLRQLPLPAFNVTARSASAPSPQGSDTGDTEPADPTSFPATDSL